MNKKELIDKIKNLEGLESDDKAYLINLVNTKKKYGLVWEDKPEDVEEQLRANLPVLKEVKEKAIINGEGHPNHILIEGDNLHALTALTFTHENKIDLIYIDPPYNTGKDENKDFYYNDKFIDKEDSFRHSKWLSFMEKRIKISHKLLKKTGVLFASIDDNEQSNFVSLLDEVFGESNRIAILPTIMNLKGNQDEFGFAGTHEYTLVYAFDKKQCSFSEFPIDSEEVLKKWDKDDIGLYKKGATLRATGTADKRADRGDMFYPILVKDNVVSTISIEEHSLIYDNKTKVFNDMHLENLRKKYEHLGYEFILPYSGDEYGRWRWGYNLKNVKRLSYDVIPTNGRNGTSLYKKQRPELGELPTSKPKSIFYKPEYSSGNGTTQLKSIFGKKVFNNPKPLDLIYDFLLLGGKKDSLILDFFAGSGTTLHSVMTLNTLEKFNQQCILVTNNENGLAEKVCYKRIKKVIDGYVHQKSKLKVEGLRNNNLRYYKTDFVPSNKTEQNKRKLTQLSTDLLCIKEDCYTEITEKQGFNPTQCRIFCGVNSKYMIVVYHSRQISEVCQSLISYIPSVETNKKIRLYVFSPEKETLLEEFQDVEDKIIAVPLPDSIYNAYRATFKTLKLDKKPLEVKNLDDDASSETDLFTNTEEA